MIYTTLQSQPEAVPMDRERPIANDKLSIVNCKFVIGYFSKPA